MLREINDNSFKKTIRLLEKEKEEMRKLLSNKPLDLKYRLGDIDYCLSFTKLAYQEIKRLQTQHKLF